MTIAGLILAGGRSTRMGGTDKAFVRLGETSLIENAIERLRPQVDVIAINSSAPAAANFGLPVVRDATDTHEGPLAGILAGLDWAQRTGATRLATIAVDTPFFPRDLVARLAAVDKTRIAVARSSDRHHPVFALWPVAAYESLQVFLERGETRKVMAFVESFGFAAVDFESAAIDPFFNVNTADDLARAKAHLAGAKS